MDVLRALAVLAVLFQLLTAGLPGGTLLTIDRQGDLGVVVQACCGPTQDDPTPSARSARNHHCCCYDAIVVGHGDELQAQPVPPVDEVAPALAAVIGAAWAPLASVRAAPARWTHPPPPLGLRAPLTIVQRT